MELPADLGPLQRPPVEFDHAVHSKAFEAKGCTECHVRDDEGHLIPQLRTTIGIDDRKALIEAYHTACIDCHIRRGSTDQKAGPVTCGECHVRRAPGVSERVAATYDYSLHARHVQALDDKCGPCHHIWDEATKQLRYEKGTEESCSVCHGAVDVERTLSLQNASHRSCVSCHLEREAAGDKGGPTHCVGCHDSGSRAGYVRLEDIPRLMCGQPDTLWVSDAAGAYPAVAFDHLAHEPQAAFCSSCHHRSLKKCATCHTPTGSEEGSWVTLDQAYHGGDAIPSCGGCHRGAATTPPCGGCHQVRGEVPASGTCRVCHVGPRTASETSMPPPVPKDLQLDPLPPFSDDFPETVVIDALAADYQPSTLPHAKIVRALDTAVRKNRLAVRFHGDTATLCAGCHHHSPVGLRPPPCRACHPGEADPMSDRPGLKVAYHRQCVGCHIEIRVAKQGCTDCHAAKEDAE
jgi:hypothetical protein